MKLAVIGSRNFNNYEKLKSILDKYQDVIIEVVSGGAHGADSLAEKWANERGKKVTVFLPDWGKFGKSAGLVRNKKIIESCDKCVAFWDGKSRGTKNSIDLCKKLNKPYAIINTLF